MQFKIQPIAGDASLRKFYRLKLKKSNRKIIFSEIVASLSATGLHQSPVVLLSAILILAGIGFKISVVFVNYLPSLSPYQLHSSARGERQLLQDHHFPKQLDPLRMRQPPIG